MTIIGVTFLLSSYFKRIHGGETYFWILKWFNQ